MASNIEDGKGGFKSTNTSKKVLRHIPLTTRGLPYDVDPRKFYEYRATITKAEASEWLEVLLYDLFGPDLIGSLAAAIDPLYQFKISQARITPINRTTSKLMWNPVKRGFVNRAIVDGYYNTFAGPVPPFGLFDRGEIKHDSSSSTSSTGVLSDQVAGTGIRKDTTYRTRPHHSDFGEFEKFKPYRYPSGASYVWRNVDTESTSSSFNPIGVSGTKTNLARSFIGPIGRYTAANLTILHNAEAARATALMQKHVLGMLSRALPTSRSFGLYREIAELKDLPRTLRATFEGLLHITSLSKFFRKPMSQLRISDVPAMMNSVRREAKRVGDNHLNLQFGWGPMLRSLQQLMRLPTVISGKVNRLIERDGVASSWRSYLNLGIEPLSSPPGFSVDTLQSMTPSAVTTVGNRKMQLRLVVNAKVSFPKVLTPYLKEQRLLDEVWGSDPRLVDLYDLIPWTWLIDWFSDVGDYVHLMDIVNDDRTLINYGFLTYNSIGTVISSRTLTASGNYDRNHDGVAFHQTNTYRWAESISLGYRYQKRKDVATTYGVKSTSDLGSLTLYQESIIGALLTRFAK